MTSPVEVWLRGPIDGIIPLQVDAASASLRTVSESALLTPREVGRKRLPSTTLGLIFHAAEHSSRHAGQIVTLNRLVRRG